MTAASGQTLTISSPNGTIVVDSEDNTSVLLANLDGNNTIWLANNPSVLPNQDQSQNVPLAPGGTIVLDGSISWYAATEQGQSANLAVIPGGISYFQFVEILAKIIEISAAVGNGLYVFSPTVALGNLIASITGANGTDPKGDPTYAGISSYRFAPSTTTIEQLTQILAGIINLYGGSPASYNEPGTIQVANSSEILSLASPKILASDVIAILNLNSGASASSISAIAEQFFIAFGGLDTPIGSALLELQKAIAGEVIGFELSGDTVYRFQIDDNGKIQWGSGSAAVDTDLYRSAAGVLETDSDFIVGGTFQVIGTTSSPEGGFTGNIDLGQVSSTSVTNNSNGFPNMLSPAPSISNGDATVTTAYKLHEWGGGTWGSTLQTLTMSLFRSSGGSGLSITVPTADQIISDAFTYELETIMGVQAVGASGEWSGYMRLTISTAAGDSKVYTTTITGESTNFATGTGGIFQQSHWASATGTPTITSYGYTWERLGS